MALLLYTICERLIFSIGGTRGDSYLPASTELDSHHGSRTTEEHH
jgi:hypothetical protein